MKFTNAGLGLIKKFEGLRLKAYPDPGTGGHPWTIGHGHTGPDVFQGETIREIEAEQLLLGDLERFKHGVDNLVNPDLTTDNEFTAMVCLAFNIGLGNFGKSSVLKFHNTGNKKAAADAFLLWNKAGGKEVKGLTNRRIDERKLFLTPAASSSKSSLPDGPSKEEIEVKLEDIEKDILD